MKIVAYQDIDGTRFDGEPARGVTGRVLIGQSDGAPNFCMRLFEMDPGGHTPRHQHEWEHEIFVHAGRGEVLLNGQWHPVASGQAVFIPGQTEHQIRNSGTEPFTFVCLIPQGAPEL